MAENGKRTGYLKEHQRLVQLQSAPHLPHALSRIEVLDFQGIKHLVVPNIPTNAQWIFLTGENGFGKTSILRAIAKGLVGDEDFMEPLPPKSHIYINGYHWNEPFVSKARAKSLVNLDLQVATYGVSRFRYKGIAEQSNKKTYSLFSDDAQLINIERILIDLYHGQASEKRAISTFEQLKKLFLKVVPQLADIKVEYFEKELITNRYQLRYAEKGDNGQLYEPVKLSDLAAGYRSILTMVGDMVIRLSENPKNVLDDLQGIVLIDEIDAHLHPKYQYELPNLLSNAFPKVQFIVSTHSPIPLLGVRPDTAVVLTVHRSTTEGITVERKDAEIEIRRLNPNALLTSPIFDFHQLFAAGAKSDEIAPTEDYDEVETTNQIKKNLQRLRELGRI
jgi:predicted ATP-binding protein involved in virulence